MKRQVEKSEMSGGAELPLRSLLLAPLSEETFRCFTDDVLPKICPPFFMSRRGCHALPRVVIDSRFAAELSFSQLRML